jgi:hypothetical protein
LLSSQYGWTTRQILDLSLFEINWRIEAIYKRMNKTREFEMALHGVQPDPKSVEHKAEVKNAHDQLSDEQKNAMANALKEAKERKRIEFAQRG